jgi:hypothetical protein
VEVSGVPASGADGAFRLLVAARTPDPEPLEPTERTEFQVLRGCGCRTDVDGQPGAEKIDLAAQMLGHSFSLSGGSTSAEYRVAYAVDLGEGTWLQLPVEEPSAPTGNIQGNLLGVGVGCADGLLVVASGSWVTGWSLRDRKRLWNTELEGSYPSEGAGEGSLAIDCHALGISGGAVRVPLEGGGAVRVKTADGTIAR